jgi:hypothetical protein
MGVDLRKYTQKLNKDVEDMFKYKIGKDINEPPALAMHKLDDPQDFILEPDAKPPVGEVCCQPAKKE